MYEMMGKLFSKTPKRRTSKNMAYNDSFNTTGAGIATASTVKSRIPAFHTDTVTCVCHVSNNTSLSGSKDKSLVLYDYDAHREKCRWLGHDMEITKVTYGEKNDCMYSASRDKTVCAWKLNEQQPIQRYEGHELVVMAITLDHDNSHLFTGSRDNHVAVWDTATGKMLIKEEVSRNLVSHASWAKGSNMVAQTGEDKEVRIWDGSTLRVTHTFPRKQHIQTWCEISEDLNYCLTSSNGFSGNGCEATLWDIRTTSPVCEYKGHNETCGACAFVPSTVIRDRKMIATCSSDCTVKLWDQHTQECIHTLALPGSGPITSISIGNNGSVYVSGFNTGIHVLQIQALQGQIMLQETTVFDT